MPDWIDAGWSAIPDRMASIQDEASVFDRRGIGPFHNRNLMKLAEWIVLQLERDENCSLERMNVAGGQSLPGYELAEWV